MQVAASFVETDPGARGGFVHIQSKIPNKYYIFGDALLSTRRGGGQGDYTT